MKLALGILFSTNFCNAYLLLKALIVKQTNSLFFSFFDNEKPTAGTLIGYGFQETIWKQFSKPCWKQREIPYWMCWSDHVSWKCFTSVSHWCGKSPPLDTTIQAAWHTSWVLTASLIKTSWISSSRKKIFSLHFGREAKIFSLGWVLSS